MIVINCQPHYSYHHGTGTEPMGRMSAVRYGITTSIYQSWRNAGEWRSGAVCKSVEAARTGGIAVHQMFRRPQQR